MNRTKIELSFSSIHSIIRVCQDYLALSTAKRLNRRCESIMLVGIRGLQRKLIFLFRSKVNLLLDTGKPIPTRISVKPEGGYQMKPGLKCHWLGEVIETPIGEGV